MMRTPLQRYLVGGWVRDRLLGLPTRDRDWVVVGETPDSMAARGFHRVGRAFPVFLDAAGEEHALARKAWGETGVVDPVATLEDDLRHRDLTINAIAMTAAGEIVDPVGGLGDLRGRVLRHVGPSFADDPVRVLRVARLAARFPDFSVAPETAALMAEIAGRGDLDAIAPERIWQEFVKALTVERPSRFFTLLRDCSVLDRVFPEIDALFGVPQTPAHHPEIDTGLHTMLALDVAAGLSGDPLVRFGALVHDLGKAVTPRTIWPRHPGHERRGADIVGNLVRRLAGPAAYADFGRLVATWHGAVAKAAELRPGTILKILDRVDAFHRPERLEGLLTVCMADARGRTGRENIPYLPADLFRRALAAANPITARQLIDQGMPPSPQIAQVLHQNRARAIARALAAAPSADDGKILIS